MAASTRRTRHRSGFFRTLVLLAFAAGVALLGPRLTRAYSALQWTRHHAAATPDAVGDSATGAARWAVRTLDEAAPLPWGATACRLALDLGVSQEATNPTASLALYSRLAKALERITANRWRGWGLASLLEEARRREQALRERPDVVK